MATKRVSGDNGYLKFATLDTAISDSGTLSEGWYVIISRGGASGLPVNSGAAGAQDVGAKYMIYSDGTITLATGDSVYPLIETSSCDINAWTLEFTKDETEVTTFCDNIKKYIISDTSDATGSISGVNTIGITDQANGLTNQFITIVDTPNDGSTADLFPNSTEILLLELYTNVSSTNGENIDFYFLPVSLSSFSASSEKQGNPAQAFSSNFRVSPSDNVEPALYTRAGV